MLTLHYNNQDIPTGRDFSLRMEWMNPVCFMDSIPGNAGLGIEIEFAHRLDLVSLDHEGCVVSIAIAFDESVGERITCIRIDARQRTDSRSDG